MPRHARARDEGDDSFTWIYERHPDLKGKIGDYLAAKAVAQKTVAVAARNETVRPQR